MPPLLWQSLICISRKDCLLYPIASPGGCYTCLKPSVSLTRLLMLPHTPFFSTLSHVRRWHYHLSSSTNQISASSVIPPLLYAFISKSGWVYFQNLGESPPSLQCDSGHSVCGRHPFPWCPQMPPTRASCFFSCSPIILHTVVFSKLELNPITLFSKTFHWTLLHWE